MLSENKRKMLIEYFEEKASQCQTLDQKSVYLTQAVKLANHEHDHIEGIEQTPKAYFDWWIGRGE